MEITVDGTAVKVDGAEPVPYADISEVNTLIAGLHLATPPELLGAPACKACPAAGRRRYATNAIAYRRGGASVVVLVNLCAEDIRTERIWSGIFGWPLHVLPEPLTLAEQYLFELGSDSDRALLEECLGAHRDVLDALTGNDRDTGDPAAAGNAGYAGTEPQAVLSSPPSGNLSVKRARRRPVPCLPEGEGSS